MKPGLQHTELGFEVEPMGQMIVEVGRDASWEFQEGPFGGQSSRDLRGIVWKTPSFEARSVWANGTFRYGAEAAEAEIRAVLKPDDETFMHLRYLARFSAKTRLSYTMTGQIEASAKSPRFKWTDLAQIVGVGDLDTSTLLLTYDVGVLHPRRTAPRQNG